MLAGGIVGWILWMFLPQQYNASVRLSVGIDYNRTGKLENLQEDRIFGITEDILHSDAVMKLVFERSTEPDYSTFFRHTLVSRTNETWRLTINGKDPAEAGQLALLWLDSAYDSLLFAQEHAVRAESLQNELDGLTLCMQNSAQNVLPSGCPEDREEILRLVERYSQDVQNELSLSHGLSTAVMIGSRNPKQLEINPASRGAAFDTLFGALIGLLIAMALPWFPQEKERE